MTARITSSTKINGVIKHVVEDENGITLGWINEGTEIWADYVGNMQFGDTPKYATVADALKSF